MPKRFLAVEHAAQAKFESTTPHEGAKLVGDWIGEVAKLGLPGAKGLHGDLTKLEQALREDQADPAVVRTLLGRIGPATVKLADRCDDEKVAEKVRTLGEALATAA